MVSKTWESADKTVKKEIIKPGEFFETPTEGSTVHLKLDWIKFNRIAVNDLKERFNSDILVNYSVPKKVLVIGESCSELDRQIERALQMMVKGEKSWVTVLMTTNDVEQPVSIKFQVKLKQLKLFKPIWEWTPKEKYQMALKYKEMGVRLYKEGRIVDAFHKFSRACKIIITLEPIPDLELEKELEDNLNNLRLILYNNMAECQLNRKNYKHTISLCNKIIPKDENNIKALYRRGVAYGSLNDVENAVADLKKVLALEPHNTAAKEHYAVYNARLIESNQRAKDMVKRMFKS